MKSEADSSPNSESSSEPRFESASPADSGPSKDEDSLTPTPPPKKKKKPPPPPPPPPPPGAPVGTCASTSAPVLSAAGVFSGRISVSARARTRSSWLARTTRWVAAASAIMAMTMSALSASRCAVGSSRTGYGLPAEAVQHPHQRETTLLAGAERGRLGGQFRGQTGSSRRTVPVHDQSEQTEFGTDGGGEHPRRLRHIGRRHRCDGGPGVGRQAADQRAQNGGLPRAPSVR